MPANQDLDPRPLSLDPRTALQAEMLANRVKKRLKHLQKWAKRAGFEAFRLYDRDIPEIPLVLDLYGSVISGALYKRPYEKDPAKEAIWLEAMRSSLSKSLGTDTVNIIIKLRQRKKKGIGADVSNLSVKETRNDFIRKPQSQVPSPQSLIREGKYKFKVNLSDYLDTGLFLDRRALRAFVGSEAGDRHFLNLFCYTASFSIYAAGGGAASTDSVDLSNTYLGWARDNFALNGFEAKMFHMEDFFTQTGATPAGSNPGRCLSPELPRHRLIRADVNAFLDRAIAARYRWDSIILDPPAFSNSKMARADFDLAKDYTTLLAKCLSLLAPGGKLWFSASARSFRTSAAELEKALCGRFHGLKIADITDKVIDEDFRGKKTPKTFLLGVGSEF